MGRTKKELEAENRQLRGLVDEVYDRIADYVSPCGVKDADDGDAEDDDAEDDDDDVEYEEDED